MSTRPRPKLLLRAPLSELEDAVMRAVWQRGSATVEDVHRVIAAERTLKEATVRTILRRLEQKGHLRHDIDGRAYVYRAVEPAGSLAARAVRQIIDRFCRGSVEELVTGIVEANALSEAELQTLAKSIRGHRRAVDARRRSKRS